MGRIQSNVGLITGIPIRDTVEQLIGVASEPRDILTRRTTELQQQQIAVSTLSSRVLSLKLDLSKLKVATPFQTRTVISQKEDVLTAKISESGTPPLGNFSLRSAQTASSQQLISQRFESLDDIKNTGSLSFGFGGFVDKGISLDELNGGDGVARGEIKITDLGGNSAVVDLSLVRTVDDVVKAINSVSELNVVASVDGDRLKLTDSIGGIATLTVQEVSGGTTAADLGLDGLSTTSSSATGQDVFSLHAGTKLNHLNDGLGVRFTAENVHDLTFTPSDGSASFGVDLTDTTTLGQVIERINALAPTEFEASISADGNGITIEDLNNDGITYTISSDAGTAAADLGIDGAVPEAGSVLEGKRLVSGLQGTLVGTLKGGKGIESLGKIDITDRNGGTAEVDLSTAETLNDIIDLINASSADVTASVNKTRSGIVITDNSGGTGNFTIADNADSTETATALGLVVDEAQDSVDGGSLGRQTLGEATLLSSLKGGAGLKASDIRVIDSTGKKVSIDLNAAGSEAKTVGDVIDAINNEFDAGRTGVKASINETGDGILLTDTSDGDGVPSVEDINGDLAAGLNLTSSSQTVEIDGVDTQIIDGTSRYSIDLSDLDSTGNSVSLASLNEGNGIELSDIRLTDSAGEVLRLDLNGEFSGIKTVGELIETINTEAEKSGVGITASINDAGTGIELNDTADGEGNLVVEDVNGTTAADLKILSIDSTKKSINGFGLFEAQDASQGALKNVADKINSLESGVTASVLNDGIGFRLQLVVDETGAGNEILLDAGGSGFDFRETNSARDALLVIGASDSASSGVLISSSTNEFKNVIEGVDLTAVSTSDTPVELNITKDSEEVIDSVQSFVDSYNRLRSDLDNLTSFDADANTTGVLFGTNEALRVDTELSRLITNRYAGLGSFQSLQEIGITVNTKGKLELDTEKLKDAYTEDPQSLQKLFTAKDVGIVAKFERTIESLTGSENGLLTNRDDALQTTIDNNQTRIERFNESLDRKRERLLLQFYQLEKVIAGLQSSQTSLGTIKPITPISRR